MPPPGMPAPYWSHQSASPYNFVPNMYMPVPQFYNTTATTLTPQSHFQYNYPYNFSHTAPHSVPASQPQGSGSAVGHQPNTLQDMDIESSSGDTSTLGSPDSEPSRESENRTRDYRETHTLLSELFPENFMTKERIVPYYKNPQSEDARALFRDTPQNPMLKIEPDVRGSWFDPTDKEDPTDTTAYWGSKTKFPCKTHITPENYQLKAPSRNPFIHVVDDNLRLLLEAPVLNSISLDHSAFNVSSLDMSNNPHTKLDSLLRLSMLDNFTVDEYLKLMIELVSKLSQEDTSREDGLHLLDGLMRIAVLMAECNQRSGQSQLAAYVANKLALRDVVLGKFSCQNASRNILCGSSFLSPNLFGPLPESFKNSLKLSTSAELRFTLKTGNSRSGSTTTPKTAPRTSKRPANFRISPYNKRFKGFASSKGVSFPKKKFFRLQGQKKKQSG